MYAGSQRESAIVFSSVSGNGGNEGWQSKRACPVYKVYLIVDPAKTGPVTFIMLSSYRSDPKSVEIDAPDDYLVEYVVVAA